MTTQDLFTPAAAAATATTPTASLPTTAELVEFYKQAAAARSERDQAERAYHARVALLDHVLDATRMTPRRFTVAADLFERAVAEIHRQGVRV